jgi:hypothetical protein
MPSQATPESSFGTTELADESVRDVWFNYNLDGRGFSLTLTNATVMTRDGTSGVWTLGEKCSKLILESVDLLVRSRRTRRGGWSIP